MSYDDKKWGFRLPTRQGTAQGGATERQMLDQIGGSDGYRKSYRTHLDGSVTRLETRNGNPTFITEGGNKSAQTATRKATLDSGAVWYPPSGTPKYVRTNKVALLGAAGTQAKFVHQIADTYLGTQLADNSETTTNASAYQDAAKKCPASMFTGRMRLYVQCLYGATTAVKGGLILVDVSGAPPAIIVNGLLLDMNCGLYFHQPTLTHYVVSINAGKYYKLEPDPSVQWLYAVLTDATATDAEKERAEAYILARCVPDPAKANYLALPTRPGSAMGYGWHFNWLGDKADIIAITDGIMADGQAGYVSNHYRIELTISSIGLLQASYTLIEGPSNWRNKRDFQVVAYPLWDFSGFTKLGSPTLAPIGSGAVYCFYTRDANSAYPGTSALQTARFTATSTTQSKGATRTPSYYNPGSFWALGDDPVFYEVWEDYSSTVSSATCGAASASVVDASHTTSGTYYGTPTSVAYNLATDNFTNSGVGFSSITADQGDPNRTSDVITTTTIGNYYEGTITVYGGAGSDPPSSAYPDKVTVTFGGGTRNAYTQIGKLNCTFTQESFTSAHSRSGYIVMFPPIYDAEAWYLYNQTTSAYSDTGTSYSKSGSGFETYMAYGGELAPPTNFIAKRKVWRYVEGATTVSSTAFTNRARTAVTNTTQHFIGNTGLNASVAIPYISQFINPANSVAPVQIYTLSSASGNAAYGNGVNLDTGNGELYPTGKSFAYIGWA